MKSRNIAYLPEVDHLRAFAALLIVFYHGLHLLRSRLLHDQPFDFSHWISTTNVPLAAIDYRELPLNYAREFDAVACLSSSIFEMPNNAELHRAFSSMRGVLRDGGILVLTNGMCDRTWREKPRFIPEISRGDFTRLFVIDYFERGARFNVVDLHHHGSHEEMKVWSITYDRVYLQDDIASALQAAGFRTCSFYGNYEFQPYDKETSGMLIAVAQK